MPYEDLNIDERLAFHLAIIEKHQGAQRNLQAHADAMTDEERTARVNAALESLSKSIKADDFKTKEEAT